MRHAPFVSPRPRARRRTLSTAGLTLGAPRPAWGGRTLPSPAASEETRSTTRSQEAEEGLRQITPKKLHARRAIEQRDVRNTRRPHPLSVPEARLREPRPQLSATARREAAHVPAAARRRHPRTPSLVPSEASSIPHAAAVFAAVRSSSSLGRAAPCRFLHPCRAGPCCLRRERRRGCRHCTRHARSQGPCLLGTLGQPQRTAGRARGDDAIFKSRRQQRSHPLTR